jgi:hypothetical protein
MNAIAALTAVLLLPAAARAVPEAGCTKALRAKAWRSELFSDEWAMCQLFGAPAEVRVGDQRVTVLHSDDYVDRTGPKHLLQVQSQELIDGEVQVCHPCGARLDLHIYAWDGRAWREAAAFPGFDDSGQWGEAYGVGLVQLGPRQFGLEVGGGFMTQGIGTSSYRLHALLPKGKEVDIVSVGPKLRSESGTCLNLPEACEEVEERHALEPGANPEWFDLVVHEAFTSGKAVKVLEGADAGEALEHRKLKHRERTTRYVFDVDASAYVEQRPIRRTKHRR